MRSTAGDPRPTSSSKVARASRAIASLRGFALALVTACSCLACGGGISLDPSASSVPGGGGMDVLGSDDANGVDRSVVTPDDARPDHVDGPLSSPASDASRDDRVSTPDAGDDIGQRSDTSLDASVDEVTSGREDAIDASADSFDARAEGDAAPNDAYEGGAPDGADACTIACDFDYYVDATTSPGGDGSRAHPFATITAAIAASPSGVPKRIYVAPGTYDAALGERFPLTLRSITIEGAGADKTFIVGSALADHSTAGGTMRGQYLVTILAGDEREPTRVSKVSLRPTSPVPLPRSIGVFCDRGSASGQVPSPGGQTRLDRVTVGPGYETSVLASTSTWPSATGCNVVVTRTTLTGARIGVHATGCDSLGGTTAPVTVEMGSADAASGNTISWMQGLDGEAYGAFIEGCVFRGSFLHNSFVDSTCGVVINTSLRIGGATPSPFTLKHNRFERLSTVGLSIIGDEPFVYELTDNRFINVSGSLIGSPNPAVAVAMDPKKLGKVRRNQFIGNDFGIRLIGDTLGALDFGQSTDPGNNLFRCNSHTQQGLGDMGLYQIITDAGQPASLPMVGNAWDHTPPVVRREPPYSTGTDITMVGFDGVALDLRGSSLAGVDCPGDRVPGSP